MTYEAAAMSGSASTAARRGVLAGAPTDRSTELVDRR
jgi:hypothetical protein